MSGAQKRYGGLHRSDDDANRYTLVFTNCSTMGRIESICVGAARLISLQSIENYLNRLGREQADQAFPPSDVQLAVG